MARKGMLPALILAAMITASAGGCASKGSAPDEGASAQTAAFGTEDGTGTAGTSETAGTAGTAGTVGTAGNGASQPAEEALQETSAEGRMKMENPADTQTGEKAGAEAGSPDGASSVKESGTLAGKTNKRKEIEAFAERIQEAVADRNMESMANLAAFPLELVTTDGETLRFKDRDEFLKQNPDLIFGDDLMMAIANIDTATLERKADGITMGEAKGSHVRYEIGSDGRGGVVSIEE